MYMAGLADDEDGFDEMVDRMVLAGGAVRPDRRLRAIRQPDPEGYPWRW
jgi:hypothetical protein